MLRPLLAALLLAATAVAAPVPPGMQKAPAPITLTGPRPLLVCTAVVDDGEVKLTRVPFARRPHYVDHRSCQLAEVTATDQGGKPVSAGELKARLKKPALVVVLPVTKDVQFSRDSLPFDTGDDWRRVLADDVLVFDGEAFKFGWSGLEDVKLYRVRVDGARVLTTSAGGGWNKGSVWANISESKLDPDELSEVNPKEWAEWVRWNERRGVEVSFWAREKTVDEHRKLFREYYLDGKTPHYSSTRRGALHALEGNPFNPYK